MKNQILKVHAYRHSELFRFINATNSYQDYLYNTMKWLNNPEFNDLTSQVMRSITSPAWLQSLEKSMAPHTATEIMKRIAEQQSRIFKQWEDIAVQIPKSFPLHQFEDMQTTLRGLTAQIAGASIADNDWETLKEFEEIAIEVAEIGERITIQEYASKKDIEEIKALVTELLPKSKRINIITVLLWIHFALAGLWQYAEPYLAIRNELKPANEQPATKSDLENLKRVLIDTLRQESRCIRIVYRVCKVYTNPHSKSKVIETLPINASVVVISKKGKWARISFTSLKDGLPDTGWVLKKYLSNKISNL